MKGKNDLAFLSKIFYATSCTHSVCALNCSLNWFKSIQGKYAEDEEDLMEKKRAQLVKMNAKKAASKQSSWFSSGTTAVENTDEDDEMKILQMMGKRIEGNRREMALLFFAMNGAHAFFKDVDGNL